jgi:hypothetical protein
MFMLVWLLVFVHMFIGFHALEAYTMGYHSLTSFPFEGKQHNPPCGAEQAH